MRSRERRLGLARLSRARVARAGFVALAVSLAVAAGAGARGAEGADRPLVVVVLGAPGTPEYGAQFESWAAKWAEAARRGKAQLVRIGAAGGGEGVAGEAAGDASAAEDAAGGARDGEHPSARDALRAVLEAEARTATSALWVVLIGHGTFDGKVAKFNLGGADVSAPELAEWLKPCDRPLAVVNCSAASAPFINSLSGPGRVIVTATKSGYEYNFARFGGYLAEAIAADGADLDKDEQVSLLEAFLAAADGAAEFYASEGRLATEHALIDDNGDCLGTPAEWFSGVRATRRAREDAAADGLRANQFVLIPSAADSSLPPEVRQQRDALELAIAALRDKKEALEEDSYYDRLEEIVLELARLYEGAEEASPPSPENPPAEADAQDAVPPVPAEARR